MKYIRIMRLYHRSILWAICLVISAASCRSESEPVRYEWKELEVVATAYNSVPWQTSGNPSLAAWGDTLRPGMNSIAVSRDLIQLGLDHNTPVLIEGFSDTFWVKDKMNRRFKGHIDIYMGENVREAREWGRQRCLIRYGIPLTEPQPVADTDE